MVYTKYRQLNMGQLAELYGESIEQLAKERYFHLPENLQLLEAEQDFYHFVAEFFKIPGVSFLIELEEGKYCSAVRIEPYLDGALLEGLVTDAALRNQGYGKRLMANAVAYIQASGHRCIYSHIHKNNQPSIGLHIRYGFQKIADTAVLIDGSADDKIDTYKKQLP